MCGDSPRDRPQKAPHEFLFLESLYYLRFSSLSLSFSRSGFTSSPSLSFILTTSYKSVHTHSHSILSLYSSHGASESRFSFTCASMVVEPTSSSSGLADVPSKASLPRKSAFSCEACRKRKVSGCSLYIYIYILHIKRRESGPYRMDSDQERTTRATRTIEA